MKKLYYSIALFTFLSYTAFGQGVSPLQNIVSKLKTFETNYVVEKAYLHFDKPYYSAGDEMYFKAYVTLGDAHTLSKESGVLHVDLINPNNVIIRNILVQLENGVGPGSFSLPDTLTGGPYRVRAYTRYMKNTPEYFFDKTIPVIAVGGNVGTNPNTVQTAKPDIQFFPEGGEMVSSLLTKVAFKAIGTNGMGIDAKGVIVDNTNVQVGTFSSGHLGMGALYIQPEEGKTYKAKVTFGNGAQATVDLPPAAPKGIVLQVKDTLGKISLNIVCNKAYFQENQNKDVNLAILASGKLRTVNTKLDNRVMGMDLPEDQFSSGIMQITLFSQDGEPLSERLIFIKNASLLNITVNTDKQLYKTRDRVSVNFNAKGSGGAAKGFFSAAVIDESKVPYDDNNETTVLSYLLLTSDLKGYIEQPNFYFSANASPNDVDNLMLTQGYRRFSWKQVLTGDNKLFTIAPEKSLYISGTEKTSSGVPVVNKDVILNQGTGILTAKTDASGNFLFDNMAPFYAGAQFTLQATGSSKDKNSTTITVDKQPEPAVTNSDFMGNLSKLTSGASTNSPAGNMTSPVNADQVLDGDDISNASSMSVALSGKLTGVTFAQGQPYLRGNKYPMLIVVDGAIRTSDMKLDDLSPANVKTVELLKGANAGSYGTSGASGVLLINTRSGNGAAGQNATYKYAAQNTVKSAPLRTGVANYRSSSLAGPGHADQVVLGDEIKNATSLSSGLNGLLRGVDFNGGVPTLRGGLVVTASGSGTEPMYVIIDGVPIRGSIDNINPGNVEAVEVLKGASASIYGTDGGSGVLVITTRMQSAEVPVFQSAIGSVTFKPTGYYKMREFYAPKYDVASNAPGAGPDKRTTIFWAPGLASDASGNVSFDFYNSDGKGSYRVIVEGIDINGNPGRTVYKYKVE